MNLDPSLIANLKLPRTIITKKKDDDSFVNHSINVEDSYCDIFYASKKNGKSKNSEWFSGDSAVPEKRTAIIYRLSYFLKTQF